MYIKFKPVWQSDLVVGFVSRKKDNIIGSEHFYNGRGLSEIRGIKMHGNVIKDDYKWFTVLNQEALDSTSLPQDSGGLAL